jgi:hypothetical protein
MLFALLTKNIQFDSYLVQAPSVYIWAHITYYVVSGSIRSVNKNFVLHRYNMGVCCSKEASTPVREPLTDEEREQRRHAQAAAAEGRQKDIPKGVKRRSSNNLPGDNTMARPQDWN